jgi:hypothetical protein
LANIGQNNVGFAIGQIDLKRVIASASLMWPTRVAINATNGSSA